MTISDQEQEETDFDWFCLDKNGEVGHFTTAGFKKLPESVAQSKENLEMLTSYFQNVAAHGSGYTVDVELPIHLPDPAERGDQYLRTFAAMGDRGLYSYDIASYLTFDSRYFRVVTPVKPMHYMDLPPEIREVLTKTILESLCFHDASTILYSSTLTI